MKKKMQLEVVDVAVDGYEFSGIVHELFSDIEHKVYGTVDTEGSFGDDGDGYAFAGDIESDTMKITLADVNLDALNEDINDKFDHSEHYENVMADAYERAESLAGDR